MKTVMKSALLPLAAALLLAVVPSTAGATGFGLGISYHDDSIKITGSDLETVDIPSYGSTSYGVNLILDTAVAKRRTFNYRLSLGYEEQKFDGSNDAKIQRVALGNTFGFRIARTDGVRVFLGPRLDLGYGFHNSNSGDYSNVNFGLAPVLGVNFHLGPTVSLGLELGYAFGLYLYTDNSFDDSFSGTRLGPFVNGVILFRTSEDR